MSQMTPNLTNPAAAGFKLGPYGAVLSG